MLASNRVFGIKLSNDVSQILKRPILVAVATKFETKTAITRLACEIYEILASNMRFSGSGY